MNKYLFMIIGVGGTGSLFARDLPKLLIDTPHSMILIDGDTVSKSNLKRQSYQPQDIDDKKADILSCKINTFYDVKCESFNRYITKDELLMIAAQHPGMIPVIIGCVDNNATRELIESSVEQLDTCIYIDSANSEFEGNVYCHVKQNGQFKGPLRGKTYELDKDIHPTEKSCQAQAEAGNVQYLVTNLKMAMTLIEHVTSLLSGKIKTGVTYVERFGEVHYM